MSTMPASVQQALRPFTRRLYAGLFLEIWTVWAAAGVLLAGVAVLLCRVFVPGASPHLPWLWLTPVLAMLPALVFCWVRRWKPAEIVALADSLSGGQGALMTLSETRDPVWAESGLAARGSAIPLPRLRPWRKLALLFPALAFMAAAFWLPQRASHVTNTILADDIAAHLTATLAELKQQALVTPVEEEKLQEEIIRLRRTAEERVDASAWEAADTLRDKIAAGVADKQDAVRWAQESLARYADAAQGGASADALSAAQAAELSATLERLSARGLLAGAPADVRKMLSGGKIPTDAKALSAMMSALAKHLADTNARIAGLSRPGRFGRFDPSEFAAGSGERPAEGINKPGLGGISRGRGDAVLTWGKETAAFDRFKAAALPPGAARGPDDWAPVVEMPGAPQESPVISTPSAARHYEAVAGQTAWRRSLAPRHQSAVKKYFAK